MYTSESGCSSSGGGEATRSCEIEAEKEDGGLEGCNRGSGRSKRSTEYFLCDVGSTNGTYVQVGRKEVKGWEESNAVPFRGCCRNM